MRLGLKYQIGGLVLALVLTLMAAVGYLFSIRQEASLRQDMKERGVRIAAITGSLSLIHPPGETDPWKYPRKFIEQAPTLDRNILYVVLLDREGKLEGSIVNGELLRRTLPGGGIRGSEEKLLEAARQLVAAKALRISTPGGATPLEDRTLPILPIQVVLKPGAELMGAMGVGFSLVDLEGQIRSARLRVALIAMTGVLVGAILSAALSFSLTRPLEALTRAMARVRGGDLTQEVAARKWLADELTDLARSFNFMTEGLRDRERIKDTFKRYVSEQVAEKILAERGTIELKGERRTATVLFQDIRGFTSASEKLSPEEVVSMLNEYFTRMVDVIFKYEGTLDKFIGDAIMAVFGAPIDHGDESRRAVRCALEMQAELARLDELRASRGQPPIYAGCGIATGELVQGSIGHVRRMEYTVIGDTVNVASRIQGKTGRGQILIDERTYRNVQSEIRVKVWEPVAVKGKSAPVQIYEVLELA